MDAGYRICRDEYTINGAGGGWPGWVGGCCRHRQITPNWLLPSLTPNWLLPVPLLTPKYQIRIVVLPLYYVLILMSLPPRVTSLPLKCSTASRASTQPAGICWSRCWMWTPHGGGWWCAELAWGIPERADRVVQESTWKQCVWCCCGYRRLASSSPPSSSLQSSPQAQYWCT